MMGMAGTSSPGTAVQMGIGSSPIMNGSTTAKDVDRSHIIFTNNSSQTLYAIMSSGPASEINPKESFKKDSKIALGSGPINPGTSSTRGFTVGDLDNYVYIWRSGGWPNTPAAYFAINGTGESVDIQGTKWYLVQGSFDPDTMTITISDSMAYKTRLYILGIIIILLIFTIIITVKRRMHQKTKPFFSRTIPGSAR